ncbi:zinc finger MYM-type protein 1 [Tanacetum coccineum]
MAKNKEDIKCGTARPRLSEHESSREGYVASTPLEGEKISDSELVDLFSAARNISDQQKQEKKEVSENKQTGESTAARLFDVTLDELKSLGLDIDDIRGQGYDNGSNMKGKHQGMAEIMKDHVKGLTLKSLSTTRWESRVESVKAIKLQMLEIREALFQVAKDDNDTLNQIGANSIAENELGDFKFIVAIIIWFDILYTVNLVSKRLQSKDMLIDVAIKEVKGLISFFKDYRETWYFKSIEEANQDVLLLAEELFKIHYFLYIVDQAIASLTTSLLEAALKKNYKSDIDANELCVELRFLKNFLPNKSLRPTEVLRHLKEIDCFPNAIKLSYLYCSGSKVRCILFYEAKLYFLL